jgi:hypothetical protein
VQLRPIPNGLRIYHRNQIAGARPASIVASIDGRARERALFTRPRWPSNHNGRAPHTRRDWWGKPESRIATDNLVEQKRFETFKKPRRSYFFGLKVFLKVAVPVQFAPTWGQLVNVEFPLLGFLTHEPLIAEDHCSTRIGLHSGDLE